MIENIQTWFSKPFNSQGDALNWFMFIGFILLAIYAWSTILQKVTK